MCIRASLHTVASDSSRQNMGRRLRVKRPSPLLTLAVLSAAVSAVYGADPTTMPSTLPVASIVMTTQPTTLSATTAPTTMTSATTLPTTLPTTEPMITPLPGDGLILNFKDASINVVLDQLSEAAGFIVVKEVKPEGRISLVSKQPVHPDEAIVLLNTVLKNNGYTAIPMGRILKIVSRDKAKRANIPVFTGTDPNQIALTDEVITQVMPIRFADAVQLKQDLTSIVGSEADLSANASSNSIILTDTSANVRRIAQIISALDTQLADAVEIKVFPLKFTSASNAAKLINDLFKQDPPSTGNGSSSAGGRMAAFAQRFFGGGGPGGSGGTSSSTARRQGKVLAASDDRTNSLVVTAPPDVIKEIGRVLKELDSDPAMEQSVFTYNLKNGQAVKLEGVINYLFNGTGTPVRSGTSNSMSTPSGFGTSGFGSSGSFGSSSRSGMSSNSFGSSQNNRRSTGSSYMPTPSLSSGALRTAADLSGQVTVVANEDTNSLLVMSNPKNFTRIKEVLDELDHAVPQVLIKVLIAEVTHDNTHDLGMEFSLLNIRSSGLGSKGGTNFGVNNAINVGAKGMSYQLLEENATAAIRALETNDKTDVLSRPYVLASDNQTASIMVGQQIPIVTRTQLTDAGNQINSYQYQPVGIILNVTPHINPDGLVTLDVAPEISALTAQKIQIQPGVEIPVIASRSAQSRVAIKDGQTIVFGGLMEDRLVDHIDKMPILGDIPVLGLLFQSKHSEKTKTELLIFLTPHVASSPDLLKQMSKDEMKGVKIVPNAVEPNTFNEHMKGMELGTTRPSN